ncbi:hypothetical protein K4L44_13455 [Halosquirtibacter laminarini]|uniref:Uncharacterized protein n=1 Tax=Halosquirtibacter laminarini TaxID=3374600 RepID=A0AC61NQX8_9BACT|nr:hypothetical protein K4L44_13455 [Prolixibacteraceae bacterium]
MNPSRPLKKEANSLVNRVSFSTLFQSLLTMLPVSSLIHFLLHTYKNKDLFQREKSLIMAAG